MLNAKMNFLPKAFFGAAFCAVLCAAQPLAAARVQTQLTADVMDYNTESGDFSSSGNVKLVREGVTLASDFGTANTRSQKARMWSSARAYGVYRNENLDAKCGQIEADFAARDPIYTMTGGVDAVFGTRVLRSATANLQGPNFAATAVTHFEDKNNNLVLACDTLTGDYDSQGIRRAVGEGKVAAVQSDEKRIIKLWCDLLVYSREAQTTTGTGTPKINVERLDGNGAKQTIIESERMVHSWRDNSITATGNARAVQDGRIVSARELVYYPETGRLEAKGTPRVTVDLSSVQRPEPAGQQPAKGASSPSRSSRRRRGN